MIFWKRKDIHLGEQLVSEITVLEWKRFFSIKLFHFHPTEGKQDRFHTHAFKALSVRLSGDYVEEVLTLGEPNEWGLQNVLRASERKRSTSRFLFIPRNQYHRITRSTGCRTLLITGPWGDTFKELRPYFRNLWKEMHCGEQRKDLRVGYIYKVEGLND